MAGMIKPMCAILLVTALIALTIPQGEAIGCGAVVGYLNSCIPYLTGKGPLGGCCNGVKGLYNAAQTVPDRQSVCSCLKSLSGSYAVIPGNAKGLPGQCGVSVPYEISPSIDCSTVH